MKGLLAKALRLLMRASEKMADSPRRRAAKSIVRVERAGGFTLKCGCFVHVRASDLRRMMETAGPEAVADLESEVGRLHAHPVGRGPDLADEDAAQ